MDLKDCFALIFSFAGEIVHRCIKADVFAVEEVNNEFYNECQDLRKTLETER